jgi:hypothetical protein
MLGIATLSTPVLVAQGLAAKLGLKPMVRACGPALQRSARRAPARAMPDEIAPLRCALSSRSSGLEQLYPDEDRLGDRV